MTHGGYGNGEGSCMVSPEYESARGEHWRPRAGRYMHTGLVERPSAQMAGALVRHSGDVFMTGIS